MARDIAQVIKNSGKSDSVAFVIDDRVDVVWQARDKGIKVDGVHIGQTDMEPQEARALLGEDAIVGLSAETESLVKLINELPSGCIDYIGAGPLHVSTTKPEASVGGNDGSGHTLDEEQINAICAASEFPVVVGGGVHADDMEIGPFEGGRLVRGVRDRRCRRSGSGHPRNGDALEGGARRREARLCAACEVVRRTGNRQAR